MRTSITQIFIIMFYPSFKSFLLNFFIFHSEITEVNDKNKTSALNVVDQNFKLWARNLSAIKLSLSAYFYIKAYSEFYKFYSHNATL